MRFVLDESSFDLTGVGGADRERSLVKLLDLLQYCHGLGERVGRLSDLYATEIDGDVRLVDVLFTNPAPVRLEADLRRGLMTSIDRCVVWDLDNEVASLEALIDGELISFAPSVGFVHRSVGDGVATSCLVLTTSGRAGAHDVVVDSTARVILFVDDPRNTTGLFRVALEIENVSEREYMRLAPLAFPNLRFAEGMDVQLGRFSRTYEAIRSEVTRHLAALNDHYLEAFRGRPEPATVMARMSALAGVSMSPESPQTRGNANAWKAREVIFEGTPIRCEWHMKLSPTIDRIHFHPGARDAGPIVGIFCAHLPT